MVDESTIFFTHGWGNLVRTDRGRYIFHSFSFSGILFHKPKRNHPTHWHSKALLTPIPQICPNFILGALLWYLRDAPFSLCRTSLVRFPRKSVLRVHRAKNPNIKIVPLQQLVPILANWHVRMHVMDLVPWMWILITLTSPIHCLGLPMEQKICRLGNYPLYDWWICSQLLRSIILQNHRRYLYLKQRQSLGYVHVKALHQDPCVLPWDPCSHILHRSSKLQAFKSYQKAFEFSSNQLPMVISCSKRGEAIAYEKTSGSSSWRHYHCVDDGNCLHFLPVPKCTTQLVKHPKRSLLLLIQTLMGILLDGHLLHARHGLCTALERLPLQLKHKLYGSSNLANLHLHSIHLYEFHVHLARKLLHDQFKLRDSRNGCHDDHDGLQFPLCALHRSSYGHFGRCRATPSFEN